jgi:hypothetical protein
MTLKFGMEDPPGGEQWQFTLTKDNATLDSYNVRAEEGGVGPPFLVHIPSGVVQTVRIEARDNLAFIYIGGQLIGDSGGPFGDDVNEANPFVIGASGAGNTITLHAIRVGIAA